MEPAIQRRTLMKGAAWSTPVVIFASAAPAFAASPAPLPPTALGNTFIEVGPTGNHQIYNNGVPTIWYWNGAKGERFRQYSNTDVTTYLLAPGVNYTTPNSVVCGRNLTTVTKVNGSYVVFKGDGLNTPAWLGIHTPDGMELTAGFKYTLTIPWAATGSYSKNATLKAGFASAPLNWTDPLPDIAWVASTTVTSTVGANTSGTLSVTYTPTTTGKYYLDVIAQPQTAATSTTGCNGFVNDIAVGNPVITVVKAG